MNLSDLWPQIVKFLETAWVPVVELLVGFILGPRIKQLILRLTKKTPNKGIMTFIGSSANVIIIGIGVILAAESMGLKMNSVIALLSALGLGISLALRTDMANVAGGLQILLTKPFTVGDFVSIAGYQGKVTAIELMFSTLLTKDEIEIIVPNSNIVSNTIVNYSKIPLIRLNIPFVAGAGCDMKAICANAEQILKQFTPADPKRPPRVEVSSMNDGSVTFIAVVFCPWQDCEAIEAQVKQALGLNLELYSSTPMNTQTIRIANLDDLVPVTSSLETLASPPANPVTAAVSAVQPDDSVPSVTPVTQSTTPASPADPKASAVSSVQSDESHSSVAPEVQPAEAKSSAVSTLQPTDPAPAVDLEAPSLEPKSSAVVTHPDFPADQDQ